MSPAITGTVSGITVAKAAPTNLTATAVSASQINLSWTGAAGATGYLVVQSQSGSSDWTEVGSTAANTTTFPQTGLSAGTTYDYVIVATLANSDWTYSNLASATTASTTATTDTLWSNSYVPSENGSSSGSFELGVKFTASVAGNVTGVRFYKETDMAGYTHIGNLWSSSGTLLATATFTNESASGWQQVNFSTPVAIQANTEYIASFSVGGGYFGVTTNFFTSAGVTNGPLEALSNSVSGGDGVYNGSRPFPRPQRRRDELLGRCRLLADVVGHGQERGHSRSRRNRARPGVSAAVPRPPRHPACTSLRHPRRVPAGPVRFVSGSKATIAAAPGHVVLSPPRPAGPDSRFVALPIVPGIRLARRVSGAILGASESLTSAAGMDASHEQGRMAQSGRFSSRFVPSRDAWNRSRMALHRAPVELRSPERKLFMSWCLCRLLWLASSPLSAHETRVSARPCDGGKSRRLCHGHALFRAWCFRANRWLLLLITAQRKRGLGSPQWHSMAGHKATHLARSSSARTG